MRTKILASKIDGLQFPFLAMVKECQQQYCQKDVPLPTVFVRNIEKMRARLKSTNTNFKEGGTFFREIGFLPLVMFMVSGFYEFAEELRTEAENAIKSELSRRSFLERAGFRMFMPLTVNIVTDQGVAALTIFKDGTIQLSMYLSSSPDSTVQADFETLIGLYHSRDRDHFVQAEREGRIKITSRSWKGQQAERKLRELLGY